MTIPVEEVAKLPPPGAAAPTALAFSPDGRYLTFLDSRAGTLQRELYAVATETGERLVVLDAGGHGDSEETLSPQEKLRRERQRDLGVGVTNYLWAEDADRLLVPVGGSVLIVDGVGSAPRELVGKGDSPTLDPRFSPDGEWVSFVRDDELHVVPVAGGDPRALTSGAREAGRTHGLAEFIAQEEMGRSRGYWWSPDSAQIAFTAVDESHIPIFRIQHLGQPVAREEEHRYPFAGAANAVVKLGVVSLTSTASTASSDVSWLNYSDEGDVYLARVHWRRDGRLVAEVLSRDQRRLDLVVFDLATGSRSTLLTETSDIWINLHDGFRSLADGTFLWLSERSGFRHLYRYRDDGTLLSAVTSGEWMVDGVVGVDEQNSTVWYTATKDGPMERHVYVAGLKGGEARRVSTASGMHTAVLDKTKTWLASTRSALEQPPTVSLLRAADGREVHRVHESTDSRIERLRLAPPAIESFDVAGTALFAALYRPDADRFGSGPYPLVVSVYGGPHAQLVTNEWRATASMRSQHLRDRGFLVAVVDNRGSARRGRAFEGAIRRDLGNVEVQDQVAAVRWLVERGLADSARVGIYGWSYGGYMACMCLARAPDVFHVAVAGAPVTHWDGYDTHYTERYMGTPVDNADGYERSSVMHHVHQIRGKLLLIHGLIDENVHFRHTARLVNALIKARVPYETMLFPDERHSPRGEADRVFMEERISAFFSTHLQGDAGSPGVEARS